MWKLLLFLLVLSTNQMLAQRSRCERNFGESCPCATIKWSEAVNVTSTEVTVRWDCCNSRTIPSYSLQLVGMDKMRRSCTCELEKYEMTNRCSHTFSNLCSGYTYQITVSKYQNDNEKYDDYDYDDGYFINSASTVSVKTLVPSAPGNVTMKEAKAINGTAVNLKWEDYCSLGQVQYYITWPHNERPYTTQELELTIANLKPVTLYTFIINACNVIISSMCSDSTTVLVMTSSGEPSEPTEFEAYDVSSSAIHLRWNHPEDPNGPIDGYEIGCRPESNATFDSITATLINKTEDHLITGLEPWTNYSCSIQAFNLQDFDKIDGNRSTLTAITKPGRPDEPLHLEITDKMSDGLLLKWQHPFETRGSIDGYVVRASNGKIEIENTTSSEEFRLSGLSPWTLYNITVHAFNFDGNDTLNGKMTTVSGKTRAAAPSAPRDLQVVKTISGEIFLKWKPPLTTNGDIHGYYVKNLNDESQVILPGSILKHPLNALVPDTNYTFSVYAYNVDGMERLDGPITSVNYTTATAELSVVEMMKLLVREFAKTQDMIRKMLRNFAEENDASDQMRNNKSLPEKAPEYRTLNVT